MATVFSPYHTTSMTSPNSNHPSESTPNTENFLGITVNDYNAISSINLNGVCGLDEMNLVGDSSNLSEDTPENPNSIINGIKGKRADRLVLAHLNINFIYQKFEALKSLVQNKIDVLMISETKIDESFPSHEFEIEGFSTPFRLDRNFHGGGIILYVR